MADTILVVAPHGLDEVLGCGGTIARFVAEGAVAHLLVLNGDGTGRDAARRAATQQVAKMLGLASVAFGGFPENRSDTVALSEMIGAVEAAVREHAPTLVYVSHGGNLNIDHQNAYRATVRAYAWANPWTSSHEPLSSEALAFFGKQGLNIIQILRNPMDIMVSNAAKMTSFAGQRCPQFLLNDRRWVADMTDVLATYARGILRRGNRCHTIRYETLLEKPAEVIQGLAHFVGIDLGPDDCREIWSSVDRQTLSDDIGHFWEPGEGKWRDFIPPHMADVICAPEMIDLWRRMGYDISPDAITGAKSAIPAELERLDHRQLVWQDSRWGTSRGKRPSLQSDGVCVTRRNGLLGVTGSEFDPIMQSLLDSPLLKDMLAAAYFDDALAPSVPLLSDYCDGLKVKERD